MARQWKKSPVAPEDILDGAKTLDRRRLIWTMDLIPTWKGAEEYLSWAKIALALGTPFGNDAALCYAKRAVCRLIDALIHYNHLRRWIGDNYPRKIELLRKVGIDVRSVVYELVIDRRNDIEHSYSGATETQARHAVELCEMALPPLAAEASMWAIVTLGLNYAWSISGPDPSAEGGYATWNYDFEGDVPFLLIDYADPIPKVMLIGRKDQEVRFSLLAEFDVDEVVALTKQLREQVSSGNVMRTGCSTPLYIEELKRHLELAF